MHNTSDTTPSTPRAKANGQPSMSKTDAQARATTLKRLGTFGSVLSFAAFSGMVLGHPVKSSSSATAVVQSTAAVSYTAANLAAAPSATTAAQTTSNQGFGFGNSSTQPAATTSSASSSRRRNVGWL